MVANAGQKKRARQYAAEHNVTYQQAHDHLAAAQYADPTVDPLSALVERLRASEDAPPLGAPDQRVDLRAPSPLIEMVGGPGTGKTSTITRMIAHLADAAPTAQAVLFAGKREIDAARRRWAGHRQVVIVAKDDPIWRLTRPRDRRRVLVFDTNGKHPTGRTLSSDAFADEAILADSAGEQVFFYDDWFTEADGALQRSRFEHERAKVPHALSGSPAITVAAFRPGHATQQDEGWRFDEMREALTRSFETPEGEPDPHYVDRVRAPQWLNAWAPQDLYREATHQPYGDATLVPAEHAGSWRRAPRPAASGPSAQDYQHPRDQATLFEMIDRATAKYRDMALPDPA